MGDAASPGGPEPIARRALVRRHAVRLRAPDVQAPLSVGNGEFAFTADVTGLQTFPAAYAPIPLCTMAQWGWHAEPPGPGGPPALRMRTYEVHGRPVPYPTASAGQEAAYRWLRENPHRLHLGRVGFELGEDPGALGRCDQTLDLWTGILESRFRVHGAPVVVRTCVHPRRDVLSVRVRSPLLGVGALGVLLAFAYGSPGPAGADWGRPADHRTLLCRTGRGAAAFTRQLDACRYGVTAGWDGGEVLAVGPHAFRFLAAPGAGALDISLAFAPDGPPQAPPPAARVEEASARGWRRHWCLGGAVELAGSRDPRAPELERRIVLSQYLTAVHCAGSLPPAETGLVCNSWHGKFHLEMHWWHAAHFALWGREHLLERSLPWYRRILPAARATARAQGYAGARWPKMTGPDGRESPSPVGPLLIWQQPHPIAFAELCYRARPSRATLRRHGTLVDQSARFMASFATWTGDAHVLGPPVIPAQECHRPETTWNPCFELAYWREGLETAQRWRTRAGRERHPGWDRVLRGLSPLPQAAGLYLAHAGSTVAETYGERAYDHPSFLGACGWLPGHGVDRNAMRRSLHRVLAGWRWERTWGWDYPLVAMAAARLGEPETAVEALLMESPKNRWSAAGHVWQRDGLPVYLPANGALLLAVAMMAAGWDGPDGERPTPGFPAGWSVRHEGLRRLP